jgi:hypothetical protein
MAPPWEMPKVKRKLPGGLGNALISAIVAGVISLGITQCQSQDAARQAVTGQQVSAVVQLETSATAYYQATMTLWGTCIDNTAIACPDSSSGGSPFAISQAAFNTDRTNISDPRAIALSAQLVNAVATAIELSGGEHPGSYIVQVIAVYQGLITRCGQLIQGQ